MGDNCLLDNYQPKPMCFSSLACILRMEGFHPLYPNGTPFFSFCFCFLKYPFWTLFLFGFCFIPALGLLFFLFLFLYFISSFLVYCISFGYRFRWGGSPSSHPFVFQNQVTSAFSFLTFVFSFLTRFFRGARRTVKIAKTLVVHQQLNAIAMT